MGLMLVYSFFNLTFKFQRSETRFL